MAYWGDYRAGQIVDIPFASQGLDGASITLGTDGTLRIYKNNSPTQRTSLAGVTFSEDFDGITGWHHVRVDMANDADVGFYAAGNDFHVGVVGTVVDGKTVNTPLGSWSVENRSALRSDVAGRTIDISALGEVTPVGASLTVGEIWDEGATRTVGAVSVVNDKTGYELSSSGVIAVWSAAARTLTAFGFEATVASAVADALAASFAAAAGLVWDAATADHVIAGSTGEALTDANNEAIVIAAAAGIPADVWEESMAAHLTPGTTGASLNGAGSAGDPWATPLPGAYGAGTAGKILADAKVDTAFIASSIDPTGAADIDTLLTTTAGIRLKTDALPPDPADASDIAAAVAAIPAAVWAVGTRTLTSVGTLVADVVTAMWSALTASLTVGGSIGKRLADNVDAPISTGGSAGSTPAQVASAVWDKARADHVASGTFGQGVASVIGPVAAVTEKTGFSLAYAVRMKRGVAFSAFPFPMELLDGTAGVGLTVTCQRSLDGGETFGPCANAALEGAGGWYRVNLAGADNNAAAVAFQFTAPGAKPRKFTVLTEP